MIQCKKNAWICRNLGNVFLLGSVEPSNTKGNRDKRNIQFLKITRNGVGRYLIGMWNTLLVMLKYGLCCCRFCPRQMITR